MATHYYQPDTTLGEVEIAVKRPDLKEFVFVAKMEGKHEETCLQYHEDYKTEYVI